MSAGNARRWIVPAAVGVVVLAAAASPAAAAPPEVSVDISGSAFADGDSITVTEDPEVTVEVSAESNIDSVSIRVDGSPERTFSPDGGSFSTTVTLDLTDGNHDLTVVASASETTSVSGTVVKDSVGPRVAYTSPFSTSRQTAPDDVETVEHGNTTIAGDLWDRSGVERVRIERVYEWKFAGETRTDRQTYRISDPGDSFSRPLLLGPGDNRMKVTLVDVHGHKRIQKWTINLEDRTKPRVRVDRVERLSDGSKVRVTGVASDNTKVRSLSYTLAGSSGESSVLTRVDSEPSRERISTEFEFTTTAGESVDSLTLIAEDTAGNTLTKEVSLNFEERVAPAISIDGDATTLDGDQVRVVGTVSDGWVTRVTVETVGDDGEILSLRTVHDGEAVNRVTIDERLETAGDGTEVIVRAVDSTDREHQQSFRVREGAATGSDSGAGSDGATAPPASGDTPAAGGGGSDGGGDGDGDGGARNRVESGDGGFSVPLTGAVGLVVGAIALASVGLAIRRMRGDDGPTSTVESPPGDAEGPAATAPSGAPAPAGDAGAEADPAPDSAPGEDRDEPTADAGEGAAPGPASAVGEADDAEAGRADDPGAGGDGGTDTPDDVLPESPPEFLAADAIADVDGSDVAELVERLDADDPETVAAAAGTLGRLAADRPDLDLRGEERLRDLRLDPNLAVSEAASAAVERFEQRD